MWEVVYVYRIKGKKRKREVRLMQMSSLTSLLQDLIGRLGNIEEIHVMRRSPTAVGDGA